MSSSSSATRRRAAAAMAVGATLVTATACGPGALLLGPENWSASGSAALQSERSATPNVTADQAHRAGTTVARVALDDRQRDASRSAGSHTQVAPDAAASVAKNTGAGAVAKTAGSATAKAAGSAAKPGSNLYFGGAGNVDALSRASGESVSRHTYGNFSGSVPTGRMITVNANSSSWSTIAAARPGTALHGDMVRWAKTVKSRGGTILLAFGHEPEVSAKSRLGSAAQYQAAYRKVVSVFRAEGVTNVQWVFQATAWSYRTSTSSSISATKYYPGDAYVDVIGGDAYNWYTCGEGRSKNMPLSTVAGGVLSFAKAHGKKAALPEFAAHSTANRATWLKDGYAWMKANQAHFVGAYYFNRPPTNASNKDCSWELKTSAELSSFRTIMSDPWTVS